MFEIRYFAYANHEWYRRAPDDPGHIDTKFCGVCFAKYLNLSRRCVGCGTLWCGTCEAKEYMQCPDCRGVS